jgi:hypothetical protein
MHFKVKSGTPTVEQHKGQAWFCLGEKRNTSDIIKLVQN